ncbi:hypothetical protein [Actinomadura fibrosa]|uniref:Uncharacterized protein n=1 Tax=Actinomadura fibrosa TaxID=111802 RepID=A0ABW2Y2U5_9ACTN|nr:hypothetical protein [Actinomadura fibrosa]
MAGRDISSTPERRSSLRTATLTVGAVGAPALGYLVNPTPAVAEAVIEILVGLLIIFIILFGSDARAERAFRLLRMITNRSEPPGPDALEPHPPPDDRG